LKRRKKKEETKEKGEKGKTRERKESIGTYQPLTNNNSISPIDHEKTFAIWIGLINL